MTDLFSIAGKTALVTGGSRGIGRMIATGFVDAGAKVYVSSRNAEACDELAAELSEIGDVHRRCRPTCPPSRAAARWPTALAEREPRLHVLVNNAGNTWGAPLRGVRRRRLGPGAVAQRQGRVPHHEVPDAPAAGRRHRRRSRPRDQHRIDRRDPRPDARDLLVLGVQGRRPSAHAPSGEDDWRRRSRSTPSRRGPSSPR